MKVFRWIVIVVFVLVTGLYTALHYVNRARVDHTIPVIRYTAPVIEVPVNASREELLGDVTAYDEKDGDLTEKIIVEKISNFVEKGLSNITYAVVDRDNHTVKATRRVRYVDYHSPRFTFAQAMRFDAGSSFNVLNLLGAVDMIDGDISGRIKLTVSDLNVSVPGIYQMQAQVTNSKGDISYLRFNVTITPSQRNLPAITLSDYLIYLSPEQARVFQPEELVEAVTLNNLPVEGYALSVESYLRPETPGTYPIYYQVTDQAGRTGSSELVVIVEE